jgi:hypothetical protein
MLNTNFYTHIENRPNSNSVYFYLLSAYILKSVCCVMLNLTGVFETFKYSGAQFVGTFLVITRKSPRNLISTPSGISVSRSHHVSIST